MAGRPEGVGATGRGLLRQIKVDALRAATLVAFGDISPLEGEIGSFRVFRNNPEQFVFVQHG
ncbi:hypothetical protein [Mesorhizobium sp.]|uniref:hypothetical protein n=1 Tax=Mesorhizobium sp. TaxID=1871066 RepID=UPI000FE6F134|nr:hypothetical protein [Mesorhizobium sp.]RWE54549.1 MAG: hypothetical protein EOS67_22490 [Mesorhizobium sp.]